MQLFYYLPAISSLADSSVARNIFNNFDVIEDSLPFDSVQVFASDPNDILLHEVQQKTNLDIRVVNTVRSMSPKSVVHIPVSVTLMPNSKFYIYSRSSMLKNTLVMNFHGDFRTEFNYALLKKYKLDFSHLPTYLYWGTLLRNVNLHVVNSYKIAESIFSEYNLDNTTVIPNGIDDHWFNKSDKNTQLDLDGDPKIFYHGRLAPQKGVHILLKALKSVVHNFPQTKLYIAGVGECEQKLKSMSKKIGIDSNVVFLGYYKNLKSIMSEMDAAIYPSLYEPFSLAIVEAFSAINGPVFYSSRAGINDFIRKENCNFLAFEPSSNNIEKCLMSICESNYDANIVHAQKAFSRKFKWTHIIKNYGEMYQNLFISNSL